MKWSNCFAVLIILVFAQVLVAEDKSNLPEPGTAKIIHFDGTLPHIAHPASELLTSFNLADESFELFVPKNYATNEAFGIFAFIDSQNKMKFPPEWASVMERQKLICLIPQKNGNDQPSSRRLGFTLVGILKTAEHYHVDPKRIFTGGYSGGAHCSLHLAFLHSDVIAGNLSICGADFYRPVTKMNAVDVANYGVWPVPADRAAQAKTNDAFAFVTGTADFRHGNILDIYQGGFVEHGFRAKLIDVPGMGHQLCKPNILEDGLDFLGGKD